MAQIVCSALIGRDEQLSRLEDALLSAARGEGSVVALAGEAGVGKTRLARELRRRAEGIGATVLWGGCSEAEISLPYLPLIEAIGNHLAVRDVDEIAPSLGAARDELGRLFPQLAREAVLPSPADPTQAKARLFESIVALLRLAAADRAALLVVEDVHWADASTRELLDYLARRARDVNVLMLVTYRSDELHRRHPLLPVIQGWRRAGLAEIVDLEELGATGIGQMMAACLEIDISQEFRELMHERSEGNPFVLEELLKEAIDRGDIFRTGSRWERRELKDMAIPTSVRDTILRRLERLATDEVRVLQSAAVLGRSFSYRLLSRIADVEEGKVQSAVETAMREQLVIEDESLPETFRFRHSLTQEAIYDDTVTPRRQQIHERAADVLAEDPRAASVELAVHLLGAGRFDEAVPACMRAAEDAESKRAYAEAAALYERALPHVSDPRDRAVTLCNVGRTLWLNSQSATAAEYLDEGIRTLTDLGHGSETAQYLLVLGRCRWEVARPDLAAACYERARALLEVRGPTPDLAVAYLRIAGLHAFQKEPQPALEAAVRSVEIAQRAGAEVEHAWALNFLGLAQIELGDLEEGLGNLERSYERARALGEPFVAWNALWNDIWMRTHLMVPGLEDRLARLNDMEDRSVPNELARLYGSKVLGELTGSLEAAERTREELERLGHAKMAWRASLLASEFALEVGRLEVAGKHLPEISTRVEVQDVIYDSQARVRYHIASGDTERLIEACRSILAVAEQVAEYRVTIAAGVEGFVHAGMPEEAGELVRVAQSKPFPTGGPFLDLARGRLALAEGRTDDALAALQRAREGFAAARYRLDELRSRSFLAQTVASTGDPAAEAFFDVIREARRLGAHLIASEAESTATRLGIELDLPPAEEPLEDIAPGERMVTVMFADVRGYTAMSASGSPNDVASKIASLQRWAQFEIGRRHGLIDKFAGDAIMATFNVSGTRIDHCEQALETALALRDKAALLGISLGIGIGVGPAIVGRLAPDANVSVLGETTNLAARLQQEAGEREVLISEEAYRRVKAWLEHKGIAAKEEQLSLKGFAEPVTAFRLVAADHGGTSGAS